MCCIDSSNASTTPMAAKLAGVRHFIYLSVAQPAPVMQAYIDVRAQGEAMVRASGMAATILRPWYVLGPGHWWPVALIPLYKLFERIPSKRDTALRLGLVTHAQMVSALAAATTAALPAPFRVLDVPAIRATRP